MYCGVFNFKMYKCSLGGVLHVVNGPLSYYSRAQGFTFSLKKDTVVQKWSPALVRIH